MSDELNGPLFDIEFRHREGESTMWGSSGMILENTDIYSPANNIYDYLYEGYEMWVRDAGKDKISDEHIEFVLEVEADNMLEDGWPLGHRIVDGKLVIWQDREIEPFSEKAKEFYEKYLDEETFKREFVDTD